MSKSYIIAYDLGTSGCKTAVFDEEGHLRGSVTSRYPTYYKNDDRAEQDPYEWWQAVCNSTRKLLLQSKIGNSQILCVVFSGQMAGCLPVDSDGKPLHNSIIWADRRAAVLDSKIQKILGLKRIYDITGNRANPVYTGHKIFWFREEEPGIYNKTYKFLQAKDYIALKFTGNQFVTDFSEASCTNLFNIKERKWSDEILDCLNISKEKLPEIVSSTQIVGEISEKAAEETGLKRGTPVVIGGGDGPCAAVGAGVVQEGEAYIYLGSSAWISSSMSEPLLDEKQQLANYCHIVPNYYVPTGTMQSAGTSFEWALRTIGRLRDVDNLYSIMEKKAESVAPGSNGLIFLPYLLGERTPYWNPRAKGAFIGLTLQHDECHLLRSVLEGVAFHLRLICDIFINRKVEIKKLVVIGGGAKNDLLLKILADVLGIPIHVPALLEEANTLGAYAAGGVGIGLFDNFEIVKQFLKINKAFYPEDKNTSLYSELYEKFNKFYTAIEPIYGSH